jgi:DNA repair protein RecN (Recombination protein N)
MLVNLRIKNFAIIDELNLSFSKGFNILTGETGAGKSIILNAIHLLLGDKATEEMVRSSEEEAVVEALFDLSGNKEIQAKVGEKAERLQGEEEEDQFLIRRTVSRSGRGRALLNGNMATLGMLSEIGEALFSICGQHEHQSLQRTESHIDLLDGFGGLISLRSQFQERYDAFSSLSREIQKIREEKERRAKERDLLSFQEKEIEAAALTPGEEESLKKEKNRLAHAEKLMGFAGSAEEGLYSGEGSAIEKIQSILSRGREAAAIDPALSPLIKTVETLSIQLEEAAIGLRDYSRGIDVDPARLEEIEDRLEVIDRLKRKYGSTIDVILLFKEKVSESLKTYTSDEERLSQLESEFEPLRKEVLALAKTLSEERKRAASQLKKSIERELGSLGMKKITFEILIEPSPLSLKGSDRVEFLISPNVGEAVKPLAKIASGGELSRMMLAMKKILARAGGSQILVFDEVDSGIGGAVAEVVGRKLKELSKHHQVICVTHLPQIASFADQHHSVRKEVKQGRTFTVVEKLEKEAVTEEIARMLGGMKVTEKTRAHAKEMLDLAQKT